MTSRSGESRGAPELERPGLDLYLTPPGGGIGMLEFDAAPLLVEDAYRYARARLSELEATALAAITPGVVTGRG